MSSLLPFAHANVFSTVRRLILFILGFFVCMGIALYYTESSILYRPQTTYTPPGTAKAFPSFQEIVVPNARKTFHYGWYAPASTKKQVLVFFHGGGDTINSTHAFFTPLLLEGYGVLLVEYRGYGEVSGTPQEDDIYADTENFFDFLHEVNISDKQIVVAGHGLGAAVAIEMARRHQVAGLVLVSPFSTAIRAIRQRTSLPTFLPLLEDRYNNLAKIDKVRTPLLVLAGERDTLVPLSDSQRLFNAARDPKSFIAVPEAQHYDIMGRPFATNVLGWLRAQEALHAPQTPQHPLNLNLQDPGQDPTLIERAIQAGPQGTRPDKPATP